MRHEEIIRNADGEGHWKEHHDGVAKHRWDGRELKLIEKARDVNLQNKHAEGEDVAAETLPPQEDKTSRVGCHRDKLDAFVSHRVYFSNTLDMSDETDEFS